MKKRKVIAIILPILGLLLMTFPQPQLFSWITDSTTTGLNILGTIALGLMLLGLLLGFYSPRKTEESKKEGTKIGTEDEFSEFIKKDIIESAKQTNQTDILKDEIALRQIVVAGIGDARFAYVLKTGNILMINNLQKVVDKVVKEILQEHK